MKINRTKVLGVVLISFIALFCLLIKSFYFKEYSMGNDKIPYYSQRDKRWGNKLYGKKGTIRSSGCGPTSLAMVISGITGRKDITPKAVADWSVENGHRAEGNGSYWSLMTEGGKAFGLNVRQVSRKNKNEILNSLKQGKVAIVSLDKGEIASEGHFIVLIGITEDNKILIHDPSSINNSKKAWEPDIIFNESSKNAGENGSPFWIFHKR
ncbi:C39 family peptidase [Hathewaya histolytica]|uniref:Murein hydrolase domain-containing protein n=1 Tax=Hathewaya histolytica TaxID=1498 RepID=A0A4U9R5C4_HATHI|nr:C39 family peptidase [Hathewaya histolytica]VTQ86535.1 murein hydrolase domain-containing protein [Hathewaya histolytica]